MLRVGGDKEGREVKEGIVGKLGRGKVTKEKSEGG